MSLNVSAWSIRNPVATTLLFALLTLAGTAGFAAMKIQNFPDLDFPIITVTAALPGASPPQLEGEVARKIEDALARLQGIKHIKSTLTDGVATINAEFHVGKPVQDALEDVRDAVSGTRANLPANLQDPIVKKVELADSPVLIYAVSSRVLDEEALSWLVDGKIAKRLLAVSGVGAVSRVGGVEREIRVELDPQRLLALNVTAADVSRQLRELQQEASGGRVNLGGAEQSVRTIATVASAAEIADLDIALGDGRRVRIDQVAAVRDAAADSRSAARFDGKPVVAFEVARARGAGELDVARGAREAIEALRAAHPDVRFEEAVGYVDPIVENYRGSMMLLYEGAALAVLVVFVFLRDWRATLIAAVALPLSVIPTFAAMQLIGFSLNTVSLLSLSLVIGVLVDDAIVEIENIERHLLMGKPPIRAAREAADEIGLAVVATTFTLIAVFLPTSLMGGLVGKYFVQFGWTAAVAVFFSLVVARMLTPTMAAYLLKPARRRQRLPRWVLVYLQWARACLRRRALTLGAAVLLVGAGAAIAFALPGEFIPADDGDQTQATLTLPPGSTLQDTLAVAEQARRAIAGHAQVRSVYTAIGGGGGGGEGPDEHAASATVATAVLTVNLAPRTGRHGATRQTIERELRDALRRLPGARIGVGAGDGSEGYELVLASEDGQRLTQHAAVVERELRTLPGIGSVTSSASPVRPELVVRPDFARAADLGVSSAAIAETLRVATLGDYRQDLAKLNLSERQVPVVVRLADRGRVDLDVLRRLPVPGARAPVPLESVADLQVLNGPAELTRLDRRRNVNFKVELNGRPLGEVERDAAALPSLRELPGDIVLSSTGDAEAMAELASGFAVAMLAGIACIYAVLVLLLKDFLQPFTVLSALVLSVPGAFAALLATGSALSMPSMIGLITLMGITTKNSILLVDYIVIARRDHGFNRRRAIVDACRKRARPIVMTTLAMGAGMLPIALGIGADSSFRAPMAIVVIGGLVTSTVLCLLVVPVIYSYLDDAAAVFKRRFGGAVAAPHASAAPA
ncbi:efflux RND transporter permease subunit [Lysobacter sp. ISL-50]|uniref:efflux RND transporter permease subunit n=1 Tax=unclassified Lysobacter TaxID=2635362 RepID=UPI001BEA9F00|nr:efflux RND transporter permease subunit [Lysobacter sp. ISL-42]MBT2751678.1 efflux RND transporter permease subunit [Lysobacter sp. ISL-50]MBT2775872.1 efflux RND transporter permease subunit [Lysobacter sp. ISL-54]MBT2782164.1 efflux RND transporter permease subunit [Lysobacter sp. ISL-52]